MRAFTLLLATLSLAAACASDECDLDDQRCDGDTLLTCYRTSCHVPGCVKHNAFRRTPCAGVCVEKGALALCAEAKVPEPACAGGGGQVCEGDMRIACDHGFATQREKCKESGQVCAGTQSGDALCALSKTPDPVCESRTSFGARYCDDLAIIHCAAGFATEIVDCPFACVEPEGQDAFCAASTDPDPACPKERKVGEVPETRTCADGSRGFCKHGYLDCRNGVLRIPDGGVDADADAGK